MRCKERTRKKQTETDKGRNRETEKHTKILICRGVEREMLKGERERGRRRNREKEKQKERHGERE